MSSATQCCDHDAPAGADDHDELAWWRDREVIFPIGSGVLLAAGFVSALAQANTASLVLYWAGLLLGASTFVPGALRALLKGRLGISLLMMISAIGAVILGAVAEAAALAWTPPEALTAYLSHEVTGQPGESMAAYWARTRG